MGARGPAPKEEVRRRNERAPKQGTVVSGRPTMPPGLGTAEQDEWRRMVGLLEEMGVLHTADRSMLLRYVTAYGRWRRLNKEIASRGEVVQEPIQNAKGEVVGYRLIRNPATSVIKEVAAEMLALQVKMAVPPVERMRAGIGHEKPKPAATGNAPTALDEYRRQLGAAP